jgi:hypothetical protein
MLLNKLNRLIRAGVIDDDDFDTQAVLVAQ